MMQSGLGSAMESASDQASAKQASPGASPAALDVHKVHSRHVPSLHGSPVGYSKDNCHVAIPAAFALPAPSNTGSSASSDRSPSVAPT